MWEEYVITIDYQDEAGHTDEERLEVSDRFEAELAELLRKYNGRAGLSFKGVNSSDYPPVSF